MARLARGTNRVVHGVLALAAVAIVAAACGFVPSAYRVDLYQTSWRVTEVDGTSPGIPIQLTFNPGARDGIVALQTPCGTTELSVDLDSDGDAIGFYDPAPSAADCDSTDHAVADATLIKLQSVEEWSVENDGKIFMEGKGRIVLER